MPRRRGVARTTTTRRRIFRVKAKWNPRAIARRFKLLHPGMIPRLRRSLVDTVGLEDPIEQELTIKGIPAEDWPYLLGFSKRMLILYELFSGQSLQLEKQSLINEYVLRGYPQHVLEQLQSVVETYSGIVSPALYVIDWAGVVTHDVLWWVSIDPWEIGGSVQIPTTNSIDTHAMCSDASYVYLAEMTAGGIWRVRKADMLVELLCNMTQGADAHGIAVDDTYLYVSCALPAPRVVRVRKADGVESGFLAIPGANPGSAYLVEVDTVDSSVLWVAGWQPPWPNWEVRLTKINLSTWAIAAWQDYNRPAGVYGPPASMAQDNTHIYLAPLAQDLLKINKATMNLDLSVAVGNPCCGRKQGYVVDGKLYMGFNATYRMARYDCGTLAYEGSFPTQLGQGIVRRNGEFYVAVEGGHIYHVDPATLTEIKQIFISGAVYCAAICA